MLLHSLDRQEPGPTKCPTCIVSGLLSLLATNVPRILRRRSRDISREGLSMWQRSSLIRGSIIFVHGLRGHPFETWASSRPAGEERAVGASSRRQRIRSLFQSTRPASDSNSTQSDIGPAQRAVFWPRDYLVEEIPQARVWTYGYNADVIGGLFQASDKNSVSQHGRDLAVRLEREIKNQVILPIWKEQNP